jgi:hypothetical protein
LLLCCARASMDAKKAECVRGLLRGKIEWESLILAAERHGLRPLLCRHLDSIAPELIPRGVLAGLRSFFAANAARNFRLTAELLKIVSAFEIRRIPAIPFKGPVNAISVYGDVSLREIEDLDILVQEEKMREAEEVLSSLGYRPEFRVPRSQIPLVFRTECENAYIGGDGVRVELHWRITSSRFPSAIGVEGLWLRHRYVQLGNIRVRHLSPGDMLLVLCAHAGTHLWDKLEMVSAVAEVVRRNIDWEEVIRRAEEALSRRIVSLGLLLSREILKAELPDEILASAENDPAVRKLALEVRKKLFTRRSDPIGPLERCSFRRQLADRWWDRMLVFPRALYIPAHEDWDLAQLPRFLSSLYHPLRAFRLIAKYARYRPAP